MEARRPRPEKGKTDEHQLSCHYVCHLTKLAGEQKYILAFNTSCYSTPHKRQNAVRTESGSAIQLISYFIVSRSDKDNWISNMGRAVKILGDVKRENSEKQKRQAQLKLSTDNRKMENGRLPNRTTSISLKVTQRS